MPSPAVPEKVFYLPELQVTEMMKTGIIGAGTVGNALAVGLSAGGYDIVAVSSRSIASAEKLAARIDRCRVCSSPQEVVDASDIVFVTTPDDVIAGVVSSLKWTEGKSVVHCSGAASTDIIVAARLSGALTGAMHPLQTLAGVDQAIKNIPGSTFALEAEEPLMTTLKEMVNALRGTYIVLKASDKVLYHAAAVIACNYMVTLVKVATDLWKTFDVPTDDAVKALMPLMRGTLNNIENVGIPDCLTGPIARGDTGTIRKHIEALEKMAPETLSTYREMGRQTIPVSKAKGKIGDAQVRELERILK